MPTLEILDEVLEDLMVASKKEIHKLIDLGTPTAVSVDPDLKDQIIRSQIEAVIRDAKKHLAQRKKVHLVLIKE